MVTILPVRRIPLVPDVHFLCAVALLAKCRFRFCENSIDDTLQFRT